VGISQAQVQDGFRVLVQGNEVNIISSLPINGEFAVYNLAGQQILHGGMNETAHTKTVTLNNPSSWYIIQIKTDRGVYSQMFFLK
jgi:hypothetical protein